MDDERTTLSDDEITTVGEADPIAQVADVDEDDPDQDAGDSDADDTDADADDTDV